MSSKNEELDKFWDISSMIPKKSNGINKPVSDVEAVGVAVTNRSGTSADGENIPRTTVNQAVQQRKKYEYTNETGFIRKVELIPWGNFAFYAKFRAGAKRLYDIEGSECEYEYFFSYMPQYEQLSVRQMKYYLYWRSNVRKKIYMPVDSSYIFLYAYETLNLFDILSPEQRIGQLCDILEAYRERYPYLDKYIGEWICDICLIDKICPSANALKLLREASQKLSVPELSADRDAEFFSYDFICSISGYDHKKSKVYPEHKADWDKYMPAAVEKAVAAVILAGEIPETPSHTVRDSFSGAVACSEIKYKIAITYLSLRKNKDIHALFSAVSKYAENELRAAAGVKSRYKTAAIPESAKTAINEYFDGIFADRHSRKKSTDDGESEDYMKYYAPRRVGEADVARAMRIEEDAWDTARLLDAEAICEPASEPGDALGAPAEANASEARRETGDSDFDIFVNSLDIALLDALKAAEEQQLRSFCKAHSLMAKDVIRRINEIASETMGDMALDDDGNIIEDYTEDIQNAINAWEEK